MDLSSSFIDAGASYSIDRLIQNHPRLIVLNFGFNKLRSNGGAIVLRALKNNTALRYLDISGNQIEAAGLEGIGDAIGNRSDGLTYLNLGQNGINDVGFHKLAVAMLNNSAMQHLLLNLYNHISDAIVSDLVELILKRRTTALKLLDLSGNNLSERAVSEILKALNWRLQRSLAPVQVDLKGNNLSANLIGELDIVYKQSVKRFNDILINSTLRESHITNNIAVDYSKDEFSPNHDAI